MKSYNVGARGKTRVMKSYNLGARGNPQSYGNGKGRSAGPRPGLGRRMLRRPAGTLSVFEMVIAGFPYTKRCRQIAARFLCFAFATRKI